MTDAAVTDDSVADHLVTRPPGSAAAGAPWLVLSDFDETFWAHDPALADDAAIEQLVELLTAPDTAISFGFVTGSGAGTVQQRLDSLRFDVPVHFIGADLGTRLLVHQHGEWVDEPLWSDRMPPAAEHSARVATFLADARSAGLDLVDQPTNGQATHKANYYLAATGDVLDDPRVQTLRSLARDAAVEISVSHCNPSAGDPDGFLDVDVVPPRTGKAEIARHLQALWGIPPRRTLAFGDSGNDLDMLRCAQHSWLVANATADARAQHPRITRRPYVGGLVDSIHETLPRKTV